MKKILLMSVLCLAIIACGKKEETKQETAETTNVIQKESTQIPNPFVEVKNLDEASKIAVEEVIRACGGQAYFSQNELSRLYRDVLAGLFQPSDQESLHEAWANMLLGPIKS